MPNILTIVPDQFRYDALSANGCERCRTPHLDGLASEGMRFSNAYTCIGLCGPARTSFLTGLYPHRHGALVNPGQKHVAYQLTPDCPTFTKMLSDAGFRLGYVGKWHVSDRHDPRQFGFDDYFLLGRYRKWRSEKGYEWNEAFGSYFIPTGVTDPIPVEVSRPHFLVDGAIDLLRKYSEDHDKRAWHMRVDFHGPHLPNVIPEPYASMYPPESFEPWKNFRETFEKKPEVQKRHLMRWGLHEWTWEQWQPIVAKYYGEVSLLDYEIGRLLDELERLGMADDTIVIFTTDHGDMNANHRMYDKGYSMYDEVYHVPLVV